MITRSDSMDDKLALMGIFGRRLSLDKVAGNYSLDRKTIRLSQMPVAQVKQPSPAGSASEHWSIAHLIYQWPFRAKSRYRRQFMPTYAAASSLFYRSVSLTILERPQQLEFAPAVEVFGQRRMKTKLPRCATNGDE